MTTGLCVISPGHVMGSTSTPFPGDLSALWRKVMLRSVMAVMEFIALMLAGVACGQDYPVKPVRIITGAAGGGSDFTARLVAQGISAPLGQAVVVDNRGSSLVSSEAVAKSPPDGYTLLMTGST